MKSLPKLFIVPLLFFSMSILLVSCDTKKRTGIPAAADKSKSDLAHDAVSARRPLHPVELTLLPTRGNAASSSLYSEQFRYAELPRGFDTPRLRVDAELLENNANADKWRLTISPQNGKTEIKEVEYTGEPIIVWSQNGQHVLLTKDSLAVFKLRQSGVFGEEQQKGTR